MGWIDTIIFAIAPLGIITAIVGAIRVGGPGWLKSIIGRARENRTMAEVELMSSTSREVCGMAKYCQNHGCSGDSAVDIYQLG